MSNTRLTVVVRKGLQLTEGLLAAQTSHAVNGFIADRVLYEKGFSDAEINWLAEPYLSVLAVNTLEELNLIEEHAKREELPVYAWSDTIPSHIFDGQFLQCKVGLSIGPSDFDKIKIVTGVLPPY